MSIKKSLSILMVIGMFSYAGQSAAEIVAQTTSSQVNVEMSDVSTGFMLFQVIKEQMVIDSSNIKNASIVEPRGKYQGLLIELKSGATNEMAGLTSAGLGKPANLIFNKKLVSNSIIQSPLGGSILISGISKEDAQLFLKKLNEKNRAQ